MQGSLLKADQFPDMNSVNASITYWDIDDDLEITDKEKNAWKLEILNELLNNINHCTCPKLLVPFVCDNNRKLHSNLCYFKCVQDKAIQPLDQ
ncbi:hypothetical protein Ocin01_13759 [Orchesella cincta]|uniref:Kazal-like domain-containing protein n=1 Tax=Orchesella cincta TaxID=48709 RepID=A0A1D2MIT2_ORCCI|nr:hypothetical protein Ocin01_13759 [Orchesella cincta]